ncbi:hypothetical protein WA158_007891 [Blastocystis sp. Blastoise]
MFTSLLKPITNSFIKNTINIQKSFMMSSSAKLHQLRSLMKKENIQAYVVPTGDPHLSEYVPDAYMRRDWLTEFSGSAGSVVTEDKALLWTDGRYWEQAEKQLSQEWTLMKAGKKDVPKVKDWLASHMLKNTIVAVDGTTLSRQEGDDMKTSLMKQSIVLKHLHNNLIDQIWMDRPQLPCSPIEIIPVEHSGKSFFDKTNDIISKVDKNHDDAYLVTDLSDIAWCLNVRGNDIKMNPFVMSWLFYTRDALHFFVDSSRVTEDLKTHLNTINVIFHDYNDIYTFIPRYLSENPSCKVIYDNNECNYALSNLIPNENHASTHAFIPLMKTCKNPVEISHIREAFIKDSVALSTLLAELSNNILKDIPQKEMDAAFKSTEYRARIAGAVDDSFSPIVAFGANASSPHYEPSLDTPMAINRGNCVLLDTGGQYKYGTTDITRTLWFDLKEGDILDETSINATLNKTQEKQVQYNAMKKLYKDTYTAVLKGHIALASAVFPEDTKGTTLDMLARQYLYQLGFDYNHGTGHGVGYYAGVHEIPPNISPRCPPNLPGFKEGMVVSDEPGYYLPTKFGIRIETFFLILSLLSVPAPIIYPEEIFDSKEINDKYLRFETLSFVPIQVDCCNIDMLSKLEKQWLIDYNSKCYETLKPLVKEQFVLDWLQQQKEITIQLLSDN